MMTNTYDEKIMNFDIANGYEAFINMFDEDEIAEMYSWLEREFGYDYYWDSEKEAKEGIIVGYIQECLCENIRNMIYNGTEQLFNIVYKVL
jgi:hypothetical protein